MAMLKQYKVIGRFQKDGKDHVYGSFITPEEYQRSGIYQDRVEVIVHDIEDSQVDKWTQKGTYHQAQVEEEQKDKKEGTSRSDLEAEYEKMTGEKAGSHWKNDTILRKIEEARQK